MGSTSLKCSLDECKARLKAVDSMSLAELEEYATRCATCGSWIIKDDPVANATYLAVSTKWAEVFNKALLEKQKNFKIEAMRKLLKRSFHRI